MYSLVVTFADTEENGKLLTLLADASVSSGDFSDISGRNKLDSF